MAGDRYGPVSKIRKEYLQVQRKSYFWALRSFRCLRVLYSKQNYIYRLTQWIAKLFGNFEIHCVRQYLVNFTSLAGIVNTAVYKATPIFTGLGHNKLS